MPIRTEGFSCGSPKDTKSSLYPRKMQEEKESCLSLGPGCCRSCWVETPTPSPMCFTLCPLPVPCRDIVLASHLRPLEKKDKMGNKRNVLWNPCAGHPRGQQATEVEIPQVREMPWARGDAFWGFTHA